ncbi:hypothetical protein WME88_35650 [Sorangium sp. So ce216]
MIETFTEIVSDGELCASISRKIDVLVSHLSLFPNNDDLYGEGARVLREDLRRYLLRQPIPLQLSTMPIDDFGALRDHRKLAEVYWSEIDHIADWSRRRGFGLIRDRILATANAADDPVALAMHLRQLIEVLHWLAFYQYGQTIAYNILRREIQQASTTDVLFCEALESFVRGAVTVSAHRVNAARAAVGNAENYEENEGQAEELAMTTAKQLAVVRFLAEEREKKGETGILEHVTRVQHAYRVCCGYVHVTPLLLGVGDSEKMTKELAFTATATISSSLLMAELFCFMPEFAHVRFGPFLGSSREPVARTLMIPVPELDMLKRKNQKIEFTVAGGRKILIYDPNSKPRVAKTE